jgi:hypothetical protein
MFGIGVENTDDAVILLQRRNDLSNRLDFAFQPLDFVDKLLHFVLQRLGGLPSYRQSRVRIIPHKSAHLFIPLLLCII